MRLTRFFAVVALLGLLGLGGAFWYRSTRPEHLLRRGQLALRQGDVNQADRLATRLDRAGHNAHAHLLRCEIYFRRHDYARAVEEFNQIQDQGDLLVEASALCGRWFLLELHRPAEAERFLRFVVSRQPDHVDAHRGLATLYYDQRAWVLAVLHLLKWAELDPRDGRAHRFMGLIYKDLDQPTPAVNCYGEALRRQLAAPVVEEVQEELAECLVAQSHYERALAVLESCAIGRIDLRNSWHFVPNAFGGLIGAPRPRRYWTAPSPFIRTLRSCSDCGPRSALARMTFKRPSRCSNVLWNLTEMITQLDTCSPKPTKL